MHTASKPYALVKLFTYISPAAFVAISKAREELGFEPKVTLEQGLPEFINWVRENS